MTCPDPKKWELLCMDLLDEQEADAIRRHAEGCKDCRAAYLSSRRAHTTLLRAFEVFGRSHDRQREELMATLPLMAPDSDELPRVHSGWFGDVLMSMKQKKGRWAAAAMLPAACLVFAMVAIFGASPTVAFTAVLGKIREARTMVCELVMDYRIEAEMPVGDIVWEDENEPDLPKEIATRGTLSMYSDGETRAWLHQLEDPPRRELMLSDRMFMTEGDKLTVVKLTGDPNAPSYIEPPEIFLRRLLELTDEPDVELGRSMIGGREAVGFEIAAVRLGLGHSCEEPGRSVVHIWVDVETELPIRVDYDVVQSGGPVIMTMKGMWDDIRWNVPLDPADFEPPDVADADEVQDLAMPPASEAALVEGLRAYAQMSTEIVQVLATLEQKARENPEKLPVLEQMRPWLDADSAYPKHLDPQTLMLGLATRQGVLRSRVLAEHRREHGPDSKLTDEQEAQLTQDQQRMAGKIGAAGLFYRKLMMEGREPEYFGATVELGDANAVLLRWQLDDGSVRVIYGDLHVETLPTQD